MNTPAAGSHRGNLRRGEQLIDASRRSEFEVRREPPRDGRTNAFAQRLIVIARDITQDQRIALVEDIENVELKAQPPAFLQTRNGVAGERVCIPVGISVEQLAVV